MNFQRHRETCQHCRTMPEFCEEGASMLRQRMGWDGDNQKQHDSHKEDANQ